jgi:hypothetical protein
MDQLTQIVREEVAWYASDGTGLNLRLFRAFDDEHQTYCVTAFRHPVRQGRNPSIVVYARIVDDVVVIEEDATDRLLLDRLLSRGIPRHKIVLAYIDEEIPDHAKYDDDAFFEIDETPDHDVMTASPANESIAQVV